MNISKELEKQILSTPGVIVRSAVVSGQSDQKLSDDNECDGATKVTTLVDASVVLERPDKLVITIPVATKSEANMGGKIGAKMARKTSVKKAVRETLGPHMAKIAPFAEYYHSGSPLRLMFVRLGGRRMDSMANLGMALKGVEDMIACSMLANDGDNSRWWAHSRQEPGGKIGVRVEIMMV